MVKFVRDLKEFANRARIYREYGAADRKNSAYKVDPDVLDQLNTVDLPVVKVLAHYLREEGGKEQMTMSDAIRHLLTIERDQHKQAEMQIADPDALGKEIARLSDMHKKGSIGALRAYAKQVGRNPDDVTTQFERGRVLRQFETGQGSDTGIAG